MKTKFLIIAFLIFSLLGAFALRANSQYNMDNGINPRSINNNPVTMPPDTVLIADETWLKFSNAGAKITTYSLDVFKKISLKWEDEFKSIHIYYKKDRHGRYKEWQITISKEIANLIKEWSKTNL